MLNWLFGRDLKKVLAQTKKVTVKGIRFKIKKVNLLNYLDGSKILLQHFDTHKTKVEKASTITVSEEKVKQHYKQVLVAGVVEPKLSLSEEEGCILVDELFIDWEVVNLLYLQIVEYTYGKKKVKRHTLAGKDLLK